jgi:hypothetical protein
VAIGGTLREIFRQWADALPAVLPAAAIVFVPLEVLIAVFEPANDVSPNRGLYVALFAATSLVATPWVSGAIARYLDEGGSAVAALGRLEGSRAGLIVGTWLASIGILVGLVLLIVPGLILAARWSLVVPAAALEQRGPVAALERSNDLVKGRTASVLAVMFVAWLSAFGLAFAVGLVAELLAPGFVSALVFGLAFDLFFVSLVATAAWVVYRRLEPRQVPSGQAELA